MNREKSAHRYEAELWLGAMILLCAYLGVMWYTGNSVFGHSPYDTYTRIALAWRTGNVWLPEDCPWLELAVYNGHYYVSFPSVPALVMLPLTFLFGGNTPNSLVIAVYLFLSYFTGYALARRARAPRDAMILALMLTLGCNLFACCMNGGVWYQAQMLSFLLVLLCAYGLTGSNRGGWYGGLFCLALSVGCRPFQAVFVPWALYRLYRNLMCEEPLPRTLLRAIPYLIAPALVALALGWYNMYRFGNPLEFGHNYLPEFTRNPETPQLGTQYILKNIRGILRLPHFEDGKLAFEKFDGCAFWLLNPLFVAGLLAGIRKLTRREWDAQDTLIVLGLFAECFLLLLHKTFGGYQFGTRYICDLLPMVYLFTLRGKKQCRLGWEAPLAMFACAVNIYGAVWFWTL